MMTSQQIDKLLPLACEWVEEQERIILNSGIELNDDQKIDAFLVGVSGIEKVRLLTVEKIPTPENQVLRHAAQLVGLLKDTTIGVSFRYGIYIKGKHLNQRRLIVHELTHTHQYERLGGIKPFLEQYLDECVRVGYPLGELEQEAIKMENKICT